MSSVDVAQLMAIAAGTGFGSAIGTELAKYLVETLRLRRKEHQEHHEP